MLSSLLPERYGGIVDVVCCLLPGRSGGRDGGDCGRCALSGASYLDIMRVLWTFCAVFSST